MASTIQQPKRLGTWQSVTSPYTAETDGFIYTFTNPSTTAGGYMQALTGNSYFQTVCPKGEGMSQVIPLAKGDTFNVTTKSNCSVTLKFLSIVGGVIRNLFLRRAVVA